MIHLRTQAEILEHFKDVQGKRAGAHLRIARQLLCFLQFVMSTYTAVFFPEWNTGRDKQRILLLLSNRVLLL